MSDNKKKTDIKKAILTATLKLIAENGFHGTPTSKIAETAGVGVGSIYRYFKNKDELIQGVFHFIREKADREVKLNHDVNVSIKDQYIQMFSNTLGFFTKNKNIFFFLEQFFHSPYGITFHNRMVAGSKLSEKLEPPLLRIILLAKEKDMIKDLPIVVMRSLIFGPIVSLSRDYHAGILDLEPKIIIDVAEACWDAIRKK